jgi:hypothetical protein
MHPHRIAQEIRMAQEITRPIAPGRKSPPPDRPRTVYPRSQPLIVLTRPMAQSLEQINQSLKSLEQQAIDLGDKLHIAHQGYRHVLAQISLEQLVMASFTLCTEAYPKEFLQLSLNDRLLLQAKIRSIGQQMQQDLRDVPSPDTPIADLTPSMPTISFPEMLALPGKDFLANTDSEGKGFLILDEDDAVDEDEDFDEDDESPDSPEAARSRQIEAELKALFSLESLLSQRQPQLPQNPVEQISFWHRQVEEQAQQCLRRVSADTNQSFQTANILPSQIPGPILEAASMADGGESFGKTPHLVRMILEAREKPPESDSSRDRPRRGSDRDNSSRRDAPGDSRRPSGRPTTIVNLITIQLRIAELEFNDINLTTWRNQIRNLLKELKTIAKEYQKKQHQQAIANAKMAWRSTWTND